MLNFFGDTRYDVSVILEIRLLSIYTSKYEGNKKIFIYWEYLMHDETYMLLLGGVFF